MAKTRSQKRVARRKSMRGGLDPDYIKGLEKKSTAELEEELKAVTDSRATASSDQLDEIDKKEIAVSNALTAAMEKEKEKKTVDDAALAEKQRNSAQLRAQGVQASRSRTDVEPLSRVRDIGLPAPPSVLPPKANAGRRRRSRKTRRYARRTR